MKAFMEERARRECIRNACASVSLMSMDGL